MAVTPHALARKFPANECIRFILTCNRFHMATSISGGTMPPRSFNAIV
ncbi:hypothetical protein PXO_05597 [Xanthomonas oryzae pv. oryzae PXO99A]|uniref:Uncharacterized protein n=1 Tax=Xanthomonas oryzae pv. oryzae (strain PXO99A) TaxID=360094 RepID=A0A0K0GKM8_XANOP|nr:hypothetical protein PXO_05597 [Xanthomonas oryzae pv. oryzae PXO99A]